MRQLLKSGADLAARNNVGGTALMYAARNNSNPEVIVTLLKAGADAKAKSNAGKTAFDYAKDIDRLKGTRIFRLLEEASR